MEKVIYRVAITEPHRHLLDVSVTLRDAPPGVLLLRMPAWTPGSYLIREYARHVEGWRAEDAAGQALPARKTEKDTWRVDHGGGDVTFSYRVYGHDLTVRTNHVDGTHAYFNGAPTFTCPVGYEEEPARLVVEPPEGWRVDVALPPIDGEEGFAFRVADFDTLVDSPVECGTAPYVDFEVAGVPHRWVQWGGGFDPAEVVDDVTRIIEAEIAMFGDLPPDLERYLFIVHAQQRRNGGLEHKHSQTIGVDRDSLKATDKYDDFIQLVAHEYFHVWNVKRIRAEGLGPFEYHKEAYTPLLWMMEGITAYYDTLIPVRAGLLPPKRYFEALGKRLATLRAIPGRHVRSLEESSFDAWIKLYRPDENTANTAVSYYLKGELAILCFDMHIRQATGGDKSFDDVMRHLWQREKESGKPITPEKVGSLLRDATGLDLTAQLDAWVRGHDDLPVESLLGDLGVAVKATWDTKHDRTLVAGDAAADTPAPWLGITTRRKGDRTVIAKVRSDGPCADHGVYPDDELVAIDGVRVDDGSWDKRLALYEVGAEIELTLFRREVLTTARVPLAERPADKFELDASDASESAREQIEAWLGAPAPVKS